MENEIVDKLNLIEKIKDIIKKKKETFYTSFIFYNYCFIRNCFFELL